MTLTIFLKNGQKFDVPMTEYGYSEFFKSWTNGQTGRMTILDQNDYGIVFDEITHWELKE